MIRSNPIPLWQAVAAARDGLPAAFATRWPMLEEFCRGQQIMTLVYDVVANGAAAKDFVQFRIKPGFEHQRDALRAAGWIEDPRWQSLTKESKGARAVAFAPDWCCGDLTDMQPTATDASIREWLRTVDGLTPLAGFEALASLLQIGVGWSRDYGRVARLEWDRGDDRLAEQEQLLCDRGFVATKEDPAVWTCNGGTLSMVFMGGTLYSHLGPLPQLAGGWPMDHDDT